MPMTRWLNIFLRLDRYTDRLERDRARFVLLMLALLTVVYAVYVTLVNDRVAPDGQRVTLLTQINHYPVQIVLLVLPFALVSVGWWLVRSGRLALAVWVPLLMLYIVIPGSVFIDATSTFEYNPASATLALFIVMGGVLARYNGILVTLIAACVSLLLDRGNMTLTTTVNLLLLYGLLAAVTSVFIQFNASSRAMGMRVADDERQKLSELVSQVTRKAASRVPLAALLDLTVELIVQKYPQFYHAQIFLVDETGVHARLHASTGPTGKILLARSHALVVGSFSVIGQVTQRGEPLVDVAGTAGSMHRYNELLPETRQEAAFPLRTGTDIIGALDLQSRGEYPFSPEDLAAFQALSDSLSLVIDNVRQFEAARQRIQENQRLAEQSRQALREVERLNKRLIGRAWTEFLRNETQNIGLDVNFETGETRADPFWTTTLDEAARVNHIVQKSHLIAVPLRVRGQIIGAMEFELDENGEFAPEDLELIQEISERFGLAAENTRLVEESQRVAQREALINEISSRMQSTNNVEATLTEAARSLYETLQARRVSIRLGAAPAPAPRKEVTS